MQRAASSLARKVGVAHRQPQKPCRHLCQLGIRAAERRSNVRQVSLQPLHSTDDLTTLR